MFEEGQEVYVKATVARANSDVAFVGFENVRGDGVNMGPYSFIVALTELVPSAARSLENPSPPDLATEARRRYLNDAEFHARVKQALMATEAAGVVDPLEGSAFATLAVGIALILGGI